MFIAVAQKRRTQCPMRSGSPAQSCGHLGRRSTAAAVVADGAARHVAAAWPVPGRVHPIWWAFQQAYLTWEDYSTHAGDAGVVINTLWCRQLTQQSRGAQLLSIVDHQLVQYFGLYRTRSAHSRTIGFAVLLALHHFYCFIGNISAT